MEILPTESFSELLVQLRNGDKLAVNEFVFKYEPFLRRSIRFRNCKSNLQPVADSVDVCQSVLSSFSSEACQTAISSTAEYNDLATSKAAAAAAALADAPTCGGRSTR